MSNSTAGGTLYIVATPIGNLGDMVQRAIDILHKVDVIAAEDTRHSAKLLQHFGISTATTAYHDHSDEAKTQSLIEQLGSGESIALISDAGTPLISDPGYRLVHEARKQGLRVEPIPGACAFVAALCASGLPSDRFSFEGFLPAKSTNREQVLSAVCEDSRTLIFYESPHRISASLESIALVMGAEREMVLARELTKTFETFIGGTVAEVIAVLEQDANQKRGEMVLMIKGFEAQAEREVSREVENMLAILCEELPLKKAAALTAKITGLKKNVLYQLGLDLNK
ncbi:16S rRNA (cytidine(1402)-2'-O)-methyltransferase [Marinagarivorans cellulosilyticus]|uniref:Ribosomal RNA small subunit methyltransferase I n=1 Tax=Marinagarivorans cellulosilyticus TaxID=2721545 RepID=A0AAN2BKF1_9GAMM|nr:16S rRNA (cytidine(1402)-2'-O)-methyltransferase [Marinagarivorans cellulosilyticus]BCD97922.1 16S rRNA (cytidine1402-2'-O)-methyltransferase [Marinagarivorans cellulosilyticus]